MRERALRDHTYALRAKEFNTIVESALENVAGVSST
jgi:hypothetical protein